MVLLYQDPHGKFVTESTPSNSVKKPGVKLNNIPPQTSRSGNDGHRVTITQFLQEAKTDVNKKT